MIYKEIQAAYWQEFPDQGAYFLIYPNGDKDWCLDGLFHRTDGPATESQNGYKEWCINGKLHRTDGPAIEGANENKQWYLNDIEYTEEEYEEAVEIWKLKEQII